MKKLLILPVLMAACIIAQAQSPQGINYQAVLYNSSGLPVANTTIDVKAGILSDTIAPVILWEELHSTVKTNSNGVFNVVIGTGTKQSGTAAAFSNINWSTSPLFLKIQVNYQGSWKYMGTSKLWSVPYALSSGGASDFTGLQTEVNAIETGSGLNTDGTYAANSAANYISSATSLKDADNKLDAQVKNNSDKISAMSGKVVIKGTEASYDSALFRVVNKDGQTVFAVYNEGVRIYVDDGAKGPKGGFAVGGFGTSKAPSQNYLYIDPDSIRAYVNNAPAKGAKGGFAVGGFGTTKGDIQDLLFVGADSIRAYIDTSTGKGPKGGFAVGGFGTSKGVPEEYLRVTRDSTRVYINNEAPAVKGAKGGFAVGGFGTTKGGPENFMFMDPDSTRFYVREFGPGSSSTFNIVGINLNQTQTLLMTANNDTVGIGGVLNVQNNLNVTGNIGYTGTVSSLVPELNTMEAANVTDTSAMVMGEIISNGGAAVIVSGVCWSTSTGPTDQLVTKTTNGASSGQYTSVITGLTPSTTYYVRAYATNANGTGYGTEITFITAAPGSTALDFDGNVYNTVVIGTQTWLASNLKTTHLNDGTAIANVTDDATWMSQGAPGYAWYNNDQVSNADYGILYNWATVNTGLLCPTGWHVPTDVEWTTLMTYAGGGLVAGGKLKETGLTHWLSPNTDATNEFAFTALPGGMRGYMGPFLDLGSTGNWWTSSMISVDPANVVMFTTTGEMMIMQMMSGAGMSIRCLKD
jgi:uncharacterized protein (TIGR02145 family)